ncbi:restriction endonuclease subunit S [Olsenella uli]|uniref:restriction endonuclease subunit S n=1 Tax=Olsenella uli TaxID=133926 RepID=UPI0024A7C0D1|nr:restriction endonuclease subunit S [Olsenella uli]
MIRMTNKPQFVGKRVSFTEAFSEVSRGVKKFKQNQYAEYGAHPIVDQGQESIAGYSDDETGLFNDVPAIVFGDHTRCVKYVEEPFFAGADGVKILKPRLSDNTRFWWHELKATPIENLGYSRHFKLLKATTFKTYDMASQTEITARLDNILDQIIQANQQIEQLDQLVKSRFVEMFGDPATADAKHELLAIGNFADVQTGATPLRRESKYYGGSIPWVKTGEVARNFANGVEENITETAIKETNCKVFPAGAVLVAMYGQGDTRGKAAILSFEAATNQACAAIMPSPAHNEVFLNAQLQLLYEDMRAKSLGGNQKNLSLGIIKSMKVILPPMEAQQEFATFVSQVDKSRFVAQQQIEKLQMLYDSLAQEYFGD